MSTTTIRVDTPFQLTHDNGKVQPFSVGDHEVPFEVADHWYVQAHSTPAVPKPEPLPPAAAAGEAPPEHPPLIAPPPAIDGDAPLYANDGTSVNQAAALLLDPVTLSSAPPPAKTNPNKPIAAAPAPPAKK